VSHEQTPPSDSTPRDPRRCPACGSRRSRPVVYGLPAPPLQQRAERGEVALGGCELPLDPAAEPDRECRDCGHRWVSHRAQPGEAAGPAGDDPPPQA